MKDVAIRCVLRAVNASKCVCGRGSAWTPLGELTALPKLLAGFGEGVEKGGEGKGREKKGEEGERKGRGREVKTNKQTNKNSGYGLVETTETDFCGGKGAFEHALYNNIGCITGQTAQMILLLTQ